MTALRITLVTESFYPQVDETTPTVRHAAHELIRLGHTVQLIAPAPGLTSYRHHEVARIRSGGRGAQIRAALERFGPDVVHVTSPGPIGRRALKQARQLGLPTLVSQQTPVPAAVADAWLSRVAARADRVVVTAPWQGKALGALGVTTHLWRPGVDLDTFSPDRRDAGLHDRWARVGRPDGPRVVVGFAGELRRRYDVRRLAELAAVPAIRPVIIGDGPQRAWLADRLPEAKLTGTLSSGDLAVAIASLDVLVHPAERLTCAHALRAAAASAVPVVAMRSGGAPDVVTHLETGLLVDPTDQRGLAEAVAALAGDSRRSLLGREARAQQQRTWADAVADLLDEHYPALRQPTLHPAA